MQNVLKRKNIYLEGFQIILNFSPSKSYDLDHSESINKLIENLFKKKRNFFFGVRKKKGFYRTGGGRGHKDMDMSATIVFLRLP